MAKKTTTIWAIQTTTDERGGCKIHNYYATRELAVADAGKHHDWMNPWPIEPDDKHIIPIEVIYEITHFTDDLTINGITYPFPNPNKFFEKYKNKMNNSVVYGSYVHLLTDYYWNKLSYQNHFKNKYGFVEIEFSDGICETFEYNSAIKIKQQELR